MIIIVDMEKGGEKIVNQAKIFTLQNDGQCGINGKNSGKSGNGGLSGYSCVFIYGSERNNHNSRKRLGITANHGKAGSEGYKGDSEERIYLIQEASIFSTIIFSGLPTFYNKNGFVSDIYKTEININNTFDFLNKTFGFLKKEYPYPWDRYISTRERCRTTRDGYNPNEKNSMSQVQPEKPQIDFDNQEREYLKFLEDLQLKESWNEI